MLLSAHEMNPLLPVMDRIVYLAGGRAASGTAAEVVQAEVLSRLYGEHVDVLHVHGRVLVVAGPAAGEGADLTAGHALRRADGRCTSCGRRCSSPGSSPARPVHTAAVIGGVVAIVSAVVGVFTVMRGQSFGGHALGDVSAAGGSGALLDRAEPASRGSWGWASSGRA